MKWWILYMLYITRVTSFFVLFYFVQDLFAEIWWDVNQHGLQLLNKQAKWGVNKVPLMKLVKLVNGLYNFWALKSVFIHWLILVQGIM